MSLSGGPAGSAGPSPWCQVLETHSGAVVLLGDRAYKVKKPVDLGFLDFRELGARRRVCEREVALNRRLAPDVYLGVGELRDPDGTAEPVVVMRRMPDELRLSRLVRSGTDVTEVVREVARRVAAFHAAAPTCAAIAAQGTRDALRRRWDANLAQAAPFADRLLDRGTLDEIAALVHRFLDGRSALFDDRIGRGAVVDGHGDLTPDDVFCLPDGPRLLDCLEFDDALRYVDRLDDIAFLAMGLEDLGAAGAARLLIETWAEYVDDPAPASLVHHFIAYRAFVRAKVGCLQGAQHRVAVRTGVGAYADAALAHLRAGAVTLVLVGGAPGTGKSTLAGAVADRLGMSVLGSDRIRKELAGMDPESSAAARFGAGIYDAEHSRAVYAVLLRRAGLLLGRGESVVVDATWGGAEERHRARELARALSTDVVELRCEVDADTAAARIARRRGVSDADAEVAARWRLSAAPWPASHAVDTARPIGECVDAACALVRPARGH
ncbi:AAA family ATPase [Nocardioides humi]|uniref:AAA family ATPase n=1 Tax=Nocardioides humi TaxID=449461 RepID=A0ABN2BLK1_9ACTN|nr:AAA family ATPase [Nocardioides humi]